jgi:hypothetical protein
MGLMSTPESRAQRHIFTAERAAAKLPDLPDGHAAAQRGPAWA